MKKKGFDFLKVTVKEKAPQAPAKPAAEMPPCWFLTAELANGEHRFFFVKDFPSLMRYEEALMAQNAEVAEYPTRTNGLPLQVGDAIHVQYNGQYYAAGVTAVGKNVDGVIEFEGHMFSPVSNRLLGQVYFGLEDIGQTVFI